MKDYEEVHVARQVDQSERFLRLWERVMVLPTREAAQLLVRLHVAGAQYHDEQYSQDWAQIRAGAFTRTVESELQRVTDRDVNQAIQALSGLLDRMGMGVMLRRDPEFSRLAAGVREMLRHQSLGRSFPAPMGLISGSEARLDVLADELRATREHEVMA